MRQGYLLWLLLVLPALSGCVERTLTINTQPQGATVLLNDEEIGTSPVTVSFNWYGDYRVQCIKPGYEILETHRLLEAPPHDTFPFDFFDILFIAQYRQRESKRAVIDASICIVFIL